MSESNTPSETSKLSAYQKTAFVTVGATLLLIAIGGLVRAAGAGLGCPDWPRCFGMWIPPTSADQIPPPWDPSEFNAWQTWLEYSNRLVGVAVGLLIILTFVRSWRYRKTSPAIFWGSLLAVILVAFQGWLGGQVVYSGLEAVVITAHMLAALALVALLVYTAFLSSENLFAVQMSEPARRQVLSAAVVTIIVVLTQVVIGTQVRERVDVMMKAAEPAPRSEWLANASAMDAVHRTFALAVVGAVFLLVLTVARQRAPRPLKKLALAIAILCGLQIAFGIGLAYADLPPPLQVLHLFTASALGTAAFLFALIAARARPISVSTQPQAKAAEDTGR